MNNITDNRNAAPLVSVCCLTYNQEKTIRQTIEGILAQKTKFPFELIVHDDASKDGTAAIIRDYAARYPDVIHPIYQETNQYRLHNLAETFLTPIIRGKYVAICEGDDYWTDPHKLQMQVDCMEQDVNRALCFHAVTQLNEDGSKMIYRPVKKTGAVPSDLVIKRGGMFCPTVSLFFRRDVAVCWPLFRKQADVYDYPVQVLAAAMGEVYYLDRNMGVYRFASGDSWTAQRVAAADRAHAENESHWLALFNEYTAGKYQKAVCYHMAHLWFTEYRKTIDSADKARAKQYVSVLPLKERMTFSILFALFTILGKRANVIWCYLKKFMLK